MPLLGCCCSLPSPDAHDSPVTQSRAPSLPALLLTPLTSAVSCKVDGIGGIEVAI